MHGTCRTCLPKKIHCYVYANHLQFVATFYQLNDFLLDFSMYNNLMTFPLHPFKELNIWPFTRNQHYILVPFQLFMPRVTYQKQKLYLRWIFSLFFIVLPNSWSKDIGHGFFKIQLRKHVGNIIAHIIPFWKKPTRYKIHHKYELVW
jgi:hypothetical protein